MSAYMIVFARIHDRAAFLAEYAGPTSALIEEYGGEYLVRAPGVEVLEGAFGEGTSAVISKWPSKAAIRNFWDSADYAKLKAARGPLAECHIVMVEELPVQT